MKELIKELQGIQSEIEHLEDKIKEKLSSINDIVKEIALYIKIKGYPTEIYDVFSYESGVYDDYENVELKIVYSQGYTDVVGLTNKEFTRLKNLLNDLEQQNYEEIYNLRKENNGYYKHVLTNSIGAWQSQYCVDYNTRRTVSPYKFAKLSRIAINGTRAKVEEMLAKLEKADMIPLLTNTDGIWYYSDHGAYHDENEGNKLGNWENDHNGCEFLMTGPGSYQFVENGVCESVVRGLCNLDAAEPDRTKWKFGDILNLEQVFTYKFNEDKGVYKTYE